MSSNDPRYDESPYASDEDCRFDLVRRPDGTLGLDASVSPNTAVLRGLTRAEVIALVMDTRRTLHDYPYPEEK